MIAKLKAAPFWLLLASVSLYTIVGWIVLFGFIPLYAIPLLAGGVVLVCTRGIGLGRADVVYGWFSVFVAWAFLSTFAARDVRAAMTINLNWLAGVGLAFYAMHALRTTDDALVTLRAFLALHALALCLAVVQSVSHAGHWSPDAFLGVQPAGFEGMSFALGKNYLPLVGFGLAGTLWFDGDSGFRHRRLSWLCLTVGIAGVVVSESRSTLVGALCGILVALMLRGRSALFRSAPANVAMAAAGVALMLLAFLESSKWRLLFGSGLVANPSVVLRSTLFTTALAVFKDHWLLGVGGKNFQLLFFEYFTGDVATLTRDFNVDTGQAVPTHNMLMNILVSHGIVGFLAFAGGCVTVGIYAWRCFKARQAAPDVRWAGLAVLLFLTMYGVDMQFHNYDFDNNMWLVIGVFLGVRKLWIGGTDALLPQPERLRGSPESIAPEVTGRARTAKPSIAAEQRLARTLQLR